MTEHELKCWPEFFEPTAAGVKTFEIRRNDRGFKVDDWLHLREWKMSGERARGDTCWECNDLRSGDGRCEFHAATGKYTGRECWATVTYIEQLWKVPGLHRREGIERSEAFVAMAIRLVDEGA